MKEVAIKSVCVDPGTYKTPSKWVVVLTTDRGSESFEWTQGAAHRRIKKQIPILPGGNGPVLWPQGWKRGEKVPSFYNEGNWDQRMILTHYTEPTEPSFDDVLSCLTMDASAVAYGQSFEDFCSEFGYDDDSRKAEAIYHACREGWRKLIRLGLNIDELQEKYQDY